MQVLVARQQTFTEAHQSDQGLLPILVSSGSNNYNNK